MNWLLYAVASPALYSLTNYIDKFLVEKRIKNPLLVPIFGGLTTLILGILIFIIKNFPILPLLQAILILISGIFLFLYLIPYFKALSTEETSRVVPLFQMSSVLVLIMSSLFLRETLSLKQLFGFLFILIGGFAISAETPDLKIFIPRKSFWLMMLSAMLWSFTVIIFKFIVTSNDFWTTLAYESLGVGLASFIALIFQWRQFSTFITSSFKGDIIILFTVNELLSEVAQFAYSLALFLAPAPLVSVIGGTQPFFVLLFGIILSLFFPHLIEENIEKKTLFLKLLFIFLIFFGVIFIYL